VERRCKRKPQAAIAAIRITPIKIINDVVLMVKILPMFLRSRLRSIVTKQTFRR
jgi:hypothetical protein